MDSTSDTTQHFEQPQTANVDEIAIGDEGVTWTASEYIHHSKDAAWYLPALVVIAALAGLSYIVSHDLFTPAAVVVLGGLLLAISNRKPRTLTYIVDAHGVSIGGKEYAYDDFLSFAIIQEDSIESVMLIPQKRWSPTISLYFSPDDGQKIFDMLSRFLPFEEREKDMIDKFLHKIRF